jgi:RNA polymerase sigma-70 factor (ECF subfamily)
MRPLELVVRPLEPAPLPGETKRAERSLDFARVYDDWFDHVAQWIRALGAPQADVEDIAQEVFLVVQRRLVDFDGRNLPGWLY